MNALRLVTELSGCSSGTTYAAKLTAVQVQAIRRFARQEGFGLTLAEQVRRLRLSGFPASMVGEQALEHVLINESFHDPAYDRTTADPDWRDETPPPKCARLHWPTPPPGAAITDEDKWRIHDEQFARIEVEVAGNPDALARVRALRAVHAARRSG